MDRAGSMRKEMQSNHRGHLHCWLVGGFNDKLPSRKARFATNDDPNLADINNFFEEKNKKTRDAGILDTANREEPNPTLEQGQFDDLTGWARPDLDSLDQQWLQVQHSPIGCEAALA